MALVRTSNPTASRGLKRGAARLFGIGGVGSELAEARAMGSRKPPQCWTVQEPGSSGPPMEPAYLFAKSATTRPSRRYSTVTRDESRRSAIVSSSDSFAEMLLDEVVGDSGDCVMASKLFSTQLSGWLDTQRGGGSQPLTQGDRR